MAILSQRIMQDVSRAYHRRFGLRAGFVDLSGRVVERGQDRLAGLAGVRRRRSYALQESINQGRSFAFTLAPGVTSWVVGLEDRRMVHGGAVGGEVLVGEDAGVREAGVEYLAAHGFSPERGRALLSRLPLWTEPQVEEAALALQEVFYQVSGWNPALMKENRLRVLQQEQITQAIEDQKRRGSPALYAFEKERALLVNMRVGDRNAARSILNEMLAAIYMSSPQLVVLRARAVELISCLTRAAIEDNPLLEPLIERNHRWTEQLVRARSFEDLSRVLMDALDDFIDGIYLHGMNRSNTRVRKALDYISRNFSRKISLRTVAREAGVSPCRMAHLVRELTGRTVLQIIQQVRISHAEHLLEKTSRSCADIAYEVGFSDQSYFTKHFRRVTGTTPARYRRVRPAPVD